MELKNGDYFVCDKLLGQPDYERVAGIMAANGASIPDNADRVWPMRYALMYSSNWLSTRMRLVDWQSMILDHHREVELPDRGDADSAEAKRLRNVLISLRDAIDEAL